MKALACMVRTLCCGLVVASLAACFGKPPPEQKYLRVDLGTSPCSEDTSKLHRLPMAFKPLTTMESLDRTSVLTAHGQVLTSSLQYYWEGTPPDIVGQILRHGIECRSTTMTPVDYQPRVHHDVVLTGEVKAFNVEETNGGRFVVSIHLDLWSKGMKKNISNADFHADAPLHNFRGQTIALAATDAMARIVPKVTTWLDSGQARIKKFQENE